LATCYPTTPTANRLATFRRVSLADAKKAGKSHLVKKIKQTIIINSEADTQTEITELELYSAHEALRDLGKHHKLFVERIDLTSDDKPIQPIMRIEVVKGLRRQCRACMRLLATGYGSHFIRGKREHGIARQELLPLLRVLRVARPALARGG
jgi:hypothetical protein